VSFYLVFFLLNLHRRVPSPGIRHRHFVLARPYVVRTVIATVVTASVDDDLTLLRIQWLQSNVRSNQRFAIGVPNVAGDCAGSIQFESNWLTRIPGVDGDTLPLRFGISCDKAAVLGRNEVGPSIDFVQDEPAFGVGICTNAGVFALPKNDERLVNGRMGHRFGDAATDLTGLVRRSHTLRGVQRTARKEKCHQQDWESHG